MGDLDRPFLGTEALRCNRLTPADLRSFRRLHRDVYVHPSASCTARSRAQAQAAWLWAGGNGVLAGCSAAAIHGARWIDAQTPAMLIRGGSRRSIEGVVVRGDRLTPDEICTVDDMSLTTTARTAFDLGRWLPLDAAVVALDDLFRTTGLGVCDVNALAARHIGERGLVQLRQALGLVDAGAESPQETRLRLTLMRGGLPRLTTQILIRSEAGRVIARADMGWEEWKVLVEYDGNQHWTDERQRTWDIERFELLERLGWRVVRVNSEQLRRRPQTVIARVRAKLREAGAPV